MSLRTRLWLDLALFSLMVAAFGYHVTGNTWHEAIGLGALAFAGVHNGVNWRWYRALPKGRYRTRRGLSTLVNTLLLTATLVMFVSGLANSRLIETYLGLATDAIPREVHSTAAYWALVFASLHVGLHTSVIGSEATRVLRLSAPGRAVVLSLWGGLAAMFVFGAYAASDRDLLAKLFAVYSFDFWDPSFPVVLYFGEYLAIVVVGATLGHWIAKAVKHWA